jgi:hypothetical protein
MSLENNEALEWLSLIEKKRQEDLKTLNAQLSDIANEVDIVSSKADTASLKADAMASGSPKGIYATLVALQTAFPTGTTGAYLVTADGKWYYWNVSAWIAGGMYQSTGIADGVILYKMLGSGINSDLSKDYTLNGDISSLTNIKDNSQVTISSATDVNLMVTNGKNIWIPNVVFPIIAGGVTVDYDYETGIFTMNGTSVGANNIHLRSNTFGVYSPTGKYAMSMENVSGSYSGTIVANAQVVLTVGGTVKTNTLDFSATTIVKTEQTNGIMNYEYFRAESGAIFNNFKFKIQVELNSVVTSWEYPAKIANVNLISSIPQSIDMLAPTMYINHIAGSYNLSVTYNKKLKDYVAKIGEDVELIKDQLLWVEHNTKWKDKQILAIGDSLSVLSKWQDKVALMHSCTFTNHVKGGIGLVQMVDGDGAPTDPIPPLTSSDVSGKDAIILFGGINERDTVYGALGNLYPTQNTLYGRMQYVINKLYSLLQVAGNLTCKILVVAPHCCGKYSWIDVDGYGEYPVGSGQTLELMVNNIKTCAQYNNLKVVDLWHNSGIGRNTWNVYTASPTPIQDPPNGGALFPNNSDQVHLNDLGYTMIGSIIGQEMYFI